MPRDGDSVEMIPRDSDDQAAPITRESIEGRSVQQIVQQRGMAVALRRCRVESARAFVEWERGRASLL